MKGPAGPFFDRPLSADHPGRSNTENGDRRAEGISTCLLTKVKLWLPDPGSRFAWPRRRPRAWVLLPLQSQVLSCHEATSAPYLVDVSPACRLRGQRILAA